VTLGAGVESIGEYAFSYCSSLTTFIYYGCHTISTDKVFFASSSLPAVCVSPAYESNKFSGLDATKDCKSLDKCGPNLLFSIDEDTLTISGTGEMYDYSDTYIAPWYDDRLSIKSIEIEDGVTTIGSYAFYECDCFSSVTIPSSITSIGDYAFSYCSGLDYIDVKESNEHYQSIDGVLYNKEGNILVQYPQAMINTSYIIPDTVTFIGNGSFYNNSNLNKVTIGEKVETIGEYAFSSCSFARITIPDSVKSIKSYSFSESSVVFVNIGSGVEEIETLAFENCMSLNRVFYNGSHIITTPNVFAFCTYLNQVCVSSAYESDEFCCIPVTRDCEPLDKCGPNLFYSVDEEGTLRISGTGEMYDYSEFSLPPWYDLRSYIQAIMIDEGVATIGSYAFYECDTFKNITIPTSTNTIGDNAFSLCSSLEYVDVKSGNSYYQSKDGVLYDKYVTTLILYPPAMRKTTFTIPKSVTSIGNEAFYACAFTYITIPNNVKYIGSRSFYSCSSLTNISIDSDLEVIGEMAFALDTSLSRVVYYGSLQITAYDAFYGCSSLSSVCVSPSYESDQFCGIPVNHECKEFDNESCGNNLEYPLYQGLLLILLFLGLFH